MARGRAAEDDRHRPRRHRTERDTPDLFLRFARLYKGGYSLDCILSWVHEYGLLGLPEGNRGYGGPDETVARFWGEVEEAAGVLAMYEAVLNGDARAAKRLALEDFPSLGAPELRCDMPRLTAEERRREISEIAARVERDPTDGGFGGDYLAYVLNAAAEKVQWELHSSCHPRLELDLSVKEGSLRWSNTPAGLVADWEIDTLMAAMYLQMYRLMGAGGDVTRCRQCRNIIALTSPGPGMRKPPQHKKYCDSACRQRHYYLVRTKPKRQSKT